MISIIITSINLKAIIEVTYTIFYDTNNIYIVYIIIFIINSIYNLTFYKFTIYR